MEQITKTTNGIQKYFVMKYLLLMQQTVANCCKTCCWKQV